MFPILPQDLEAVALYRDFLPRRIFDAHVHLHAEGTVPHSFNPNGSFRRPSATVEDYLTDVRPFFPDVDSLSMQMMPMPDPVMNDRTNGLRDRANLHVSSQLASHAGNVGAVYVMRGDSEEEIERMLSLPHVGSIKCYWFSAEKANGEDCTVSEFLPEAAWRVAHRRHLPIVLHMMHAHALSDPRNYTYVTRMASRYPNANLILAHCARAFAAWTGVRAIRELEDCGNIWFDLASVCEPDPMMACILKYGGNRVLWGTDYPICMFRGKAVSIGSGFCWLDAAHLPASAKPTTVLAESLSALYRSSLLLDLDQTQIDRIFFSNAASLFS